MSEPLPALPGQTGFSVALLDPDLPVPAGLVDPSGKPDPKRFAVYRNNVMASLTTALADIFPTVCRLVGADFFKRMAAIHVRDNPPESPLLFEYGRAFPGFLEGFEPVAGLPYLPDVARLERLWLDSFHAADAVPLQPSLLAGLAPDELAAITLVPHPAMHLLASSHAIVSILAADRSGESLSGIDPAKAEIALVTRPDCDVMISRVSPGAAIFYRALMEGRPLGEAAGQAQAEHPDIDLPETIGLMLATGAFCHPDTREPIR